MKSKSSRRHQPAQARRLSQTGRMKSRTSSRKKDWIPVKARHDYVRLSSPSHGLLEHRCRSLKSSARSNLARRADCGSGRNAHRNEEPGELSQPRCLTRTGTDFFTSSGLPPTARHPPGCRAVSFLISPCSGRNGRSGWETCGLPFSGRLVSADRTGCPIERILQAG